MKRILIYNTGNWTGVNEQGVEVYGELDIDLLTQLSEIVDNEDDETTKKIKQAEKKVEQAKEEAKKDVEKVVTPLRSMFRFAPDELVLENYRFIEEWEVGKDYIKGDVLIYEGVPYRIIAEEHTASEQFTPDKTNYIYNDMSGKINPDNPDEIMEFKQPQGYADAYGIGDKVKFEGNIYESKIDGNTWSPAQAPQHWEVIE